MPAAGPRIGLSVAVAGRVASGKTTLATRLSERLGMQYVSFGNTIRLLYPGSRRPGRGDLQEFGQCMMETRGPEWLLREAMDLARIPRGPRTRVVFDGVRHVSMATEIRNASHQSCVIFTQVRPPVRLRRHLSRRRGSMDAEELDRIDRHASEGELDAIARRADLVLDGSCGSPSAVGNMAEAFLRARYPRPVPDHAARPSAGRRQDPRPARTWPVFGRKASLEEVAKASGGRQGRDQLQRM